MSENQTTNVLSPSVRCSRCDKPLPMVIGASYNGESTKDGQVVFFCNECWPIRNDP